MMMILADANCAVDSISFYATTCVCCSFRCFLTYGVPKPLVFSIYNINQIWLFMGCTHYRKHSLSFICGFSHLFHSRDPLIVGQNNGKTLMVVYTWFYQYQHLPTSTNQVGLVFPTCFFYTCLFSAPIAQVMIIDGLLHQTLVLKLAVGAGVLIPRILLVGRTSCLLCISMHGRHGRRN